MCADDVSVGYPAYQQESRFGQALPSALPDARALFDKAHSRSLCSCTLCVLARGLPHVAIDSSEHFA